MARRKKTASSPTSPTPAPTPRCLHVVLGEGQCPSLPMMRGYCHRHIREAPWERANVETLVSSLQTAKAAMDDLGQRILQSYIVFGSEPIPEDLRREYRALWHRHNFIATVRRDRRPGDDLPVEVTMSVPRDL